MSFIENIKMALISIADNKLRSFLTMISIIIGIASVIAIVSIGRGATDSMVGSVLDITGGQMMLSYEEKGTEHDEFGFATSFTDKENLYNTRQVDALSSIAEIESVILSNAAMVNGSYRDKEVTNKQLQTLYQTKMFTDNQVMVEGRIFSEDEMSKGIPRMIMHSKTAERFFGKDSAIGKEIVVNNKIFEIIGTYKEKPLAPGVNVSAAANEIFYIPFNAWIAYSGKNETQSLSVIPKPGADLTELGKRVEKTLDVYKSPDNDGTYKVMNFDAIISQMTQMLDIMTLFISMIAAISLVVGGIGVMNIMYVSVVERTQEIGLRKALGASGQQVLQQFLIESVTITTLGGLIGVGLGLLGHLVGASVVDYNFQLYPDIILLGVGFAAVIGLLFGTLPAAKAAKMQPIEALRSL